MSNCRVRETDEKLDAILYYLMEKRGLDFSGYHSAMLERCIHLRLKATSSEDFDDYLSCLRKDDAELDHLLGVLTVNVTRFFRDTLTFELIADRILPVIIREKSRSNDSSLRIWSAGCANGAEPYSMAILLRELLEKEVHAMNLHIFATDIDSDALDAARKALYSMESLEHVKCHILRKYFVPECERFRLIPEVRSMVTFSVFDLLDKKHSVPPESVFGNFDLVFCLNCLIYFNIDYQEIIFDKLYHSLAKNSYLIMGTAEAPPMKYRYHFNRVFDFSRIYQKK
ncbi:MAG: protein-glutamate O-methyltransferase CheR [Candidatus Riflebacteria bacterium]|nr:protein-glutamate O-methyltransferase CheR [Candidatus Riflebacteria bacterium]